MGLLRRKLLAMTRPLLLLIIEGLLSPRHYHRKQSDTILLFEYPGTLSLRATKERSNLSNTLRLVESCLYKFANRPIDFVSFVFGQVQDVEDYIIKGFTVGKGVGYLLANGEGLLNS